MRGAARYPPTPSSAGKIIPISKYLKRHTVLVPPGITGVSFQLCLRGGSTSRRGGGPGPKIDQRSIERCRIKSDNEECGPPQPAVGSAPTLTFSLYNDYKRGERTNFQ